MFRFSLLLSVTLLLTVRTYNHPAPRATTRRAAIEKIGFPLLILTTTPHAAMAAKVDCFENCSQNCNRVAPNSREYCKLTCTAYCKQDDRKDGLSGSVSSENAEVGLRSAYDLPSKFTGERPPVVFGDDHPPSLKLPNFIKDSLKNASGGGQY